MNGGWRAAEGFELRLTTGGARLTDENDLEYVIPFGTAPPLDIDMRGERRRRDLTARLDAEGRYGGGTVRYATAVTLEHVLSKQEEEFSEFRTSNGNSMSRGFWINRRTAISGVGLMQEFHLGQDLESLADCASIR